MSFSFFGGFDFSRGPNLFFEKKKSATGIFFKISFYFPPKGVAFDVTCDSYQNYRPIDIDAIADSYSFTESPGLAASLYDTIRL